jgi:two-component system CheB/CheR fusion protein
MSDEEKKDTQPSPPEEAAASEAEHEAPPSPRADGNGDPDPEGPEPFPVVGIGASAGGLEALQAFFEQVPPDSGLAYVVIVHLPPDHASHLPEILQKKAQIPVNAIEDGVVVEPNQAYVIIPNTEVELGKDRLFLVQPTARRSQRAPIDYFFRSLAQAREEGAIGIILSGTGTNGTVGLRAIKEQAGMVMVQAPETAAYDGMPRSAIGTDLADYILPPADMPRQLIGYLKDYRHKRQQKGVPLAGASPKTFEKIYTILRKQTGHDFSDYKDTTLRRRIDRRMTVQQIGGLSEYVSYLRQNQAEVEALFKELLIGVTNFFRDPEAFEVLKDKVIPRLLEERVSGRPVRIWVPGCSTGEEAYSLAIILKESLEQRPAHVPVQIFATDIDAGAIETARWGQYPDGIAVDVSPERLSRFFVQQEDGSFRIDREIREMVVFAEQSVTRDPPFSRLDLISCRNLLIYLTERLQTQVLRMFHYSLRPDGFLFLGSSESRGKLEEEFKTVDRKWKIFRRTGQDSRPQHPIRDVFATRPQGEPSRPGPAPQAEFRDDIEQHQIQRTLLAHYTPAAVVVDEEGRVVYLHGETEPYLRPPVGRSPFDLASMVRPGLNMELRTALHRAARQKEKVVYDNVWVQKDGASEPVKLSVEPIFAMAGEAQSWSGWLLVVFEPGPPPPSLPSQEEPPAEGSEAQARDKAALRQELRLTRQRLQSTIEELELSNEDVRSANEELQAANEELQSINEELETSQEELQSANEELVTMNADYQNRITSLAEARDNYHNLLLSTRIATLFLDLDLKIRLYTPRVTEIINLIPSDEGRPLTDLDTRLQDKQLLADAEEVLKTLIPQEREVRSKEGTWYNMRVSPYRTANNAIDGVVLTFIDITSLKEREAEQYRLSYLERMAARVRDPVLLLDKGLKLLYANPAFYRMFDTTEADAKGRALAELAEGRLDQPGLRRLLVEMLAQDISLDDFELEQTFPPPLGRRQLKLQGSRLSYPMTETDILLLIIEDVSEHQRVELQQAQAHQRRLEYVESIVATVRQPLLVLDPQLRVVSANRAFHDTFQVDPAETEREYIYNLGDGQWDLPELRRLLEEIVPQNNVFEDFEVTHDFPHIGRQTMSLNARRLLQESGRPELILLAIEAGGDGSEA